MAYAHTYQNSVEREIDFDVWILDYNFHRSHASLDLNPPVSPTGLSEQL